MNPSAVYLDSNFLITLFDEQTSDIKNILMNSKDRFIYPFGVEQIKEISSPTNSGRNQVRFIFLSELTDDNFFFLENEKCRVLKKKPSECYTQLETHFSDYLKYDASMTNDSYEQICKLRDELGISANILNNSSSSEAIQAINSAIAIQSRNKNLKISNIDSIASLINQAFMSRLKQNASNDVYDSLECSRLHFTCLFNLLDAFGYWPDTKRVYLKGSQISDAAHAMNASYFKYLVTNDKRFSRKAQAIYSRVRA
jgi:hypothetical protein